MKSTLYIIAVAIFISGTNAQNALRLRPASNANSPPSASSSSQRHINKVSVSEVNLSGNTDLDGDSMAIMDKDKGIIDTVEVEEEEDWVCV